MERLETRNVIIGAGAMGAATAYHLSRRGAPFVLIEQFAVGHDRGSSHGAARITRHSYGDWTYARLMPAAFRAWRDLEADSGECIYVRTGGVTFCWDRFDVVAQVAKCLDHLEVPHRRMSGREWRRIHPEFTLSESHDVVYEPDAGMLTAEKAVRLQVALACRRSGGYGRLLEHTVVRRLDLEGPRPVVLTDSHHIVADRLIVTAGPWLRSLLSGLPLSLEVTRQQVLYLAPPDPAPYHVGRFPIFIYHGPEAEDAFYGMPLFLGLGVKVARHGGPPTAPEKVDRTISEQDRSVVREFLRWSLPALADAPVSQTEVCLYTVARDERFLLDFYPGRPDVLIASPCSGHGFKFSCLIGSILADLSTEGRTDHAIDEWSLRCHRGMSSPPAEESMT